MTCLMEHYMHFNRTRTNKMLFFSKNYYRPKSIHRSCVKLPAIQFCGNTIVFTEKIFHVFDGNPCATFVLFDISLKNIFLSKNNFCVFFTQHSSRKTRKLSNVDLGRPYNWWVHFQDLVFDRKWTKSTNTKLILKRINFLIYKSRT